MSDDDNHPKASKENKDIEVVTVSEDDEENNQSEREEEREETEEEEEEKEKEEKKKEKKKGEKKEKEKKEKEKTHVSVWDNAACVKTWYVKMTGVQIDPKFQAKHCGKTLFFQVEMFYAQQVYKSYSVLLSSYNFMECGKQRTLNHKSEPALSFKYRNVFSKPTVPATFSHPHFVVKVYKSGTLSNKAIAYGLISRACSHDEHWWELRSEEERGKTWGKIHLVLTGSSRKA